jgi:hypothetical protein
MPSNYPAGLSDHSADAPWNDPVVPEKEFGVAISQSLSKTTTVSTDDYFPCAEDVWDDGVGHHDEWADTSETDWKKAYSYEHKTPLELIGLLKEYLEKDLKSLESDEYIKIREARRLRGLIEECDGWVDDETTIVED